MYPFLFLHVNQGFGPNVEHAQAYLKDAKAMELVAERLASARWIWSSASSWGTYFSSPYESGPALRAALLRHASHPVLLPEYLHNLYPFTLNLPCEAPLLPHIIGAIVSAAGGPGNDLGGMRTRASGSLAKFIPDFAALQAVLEDPSHPRRIRAAALIAHLLNSKRPPGAKRMKELLELYEDSEAHWILPAAGLVLLDAIKTQEVAAKETFGALLQESLANYEGRAAAEPALRAWRESPGAPIHTRGSADDWR